MPPQHISIDEGDCCDREDREDALPLHALESAPWSEFDVERMPPPPPPVGSRHPPRPPREPNPGKPKRSSRRSLQRYRQGDTMLLLPTARARTHVHVPSGAGTCTSIDVHARSGSSSFSSSHSSHGRRHRNQSKSATATAPPNHTASATKTKASPRRLHALLGLLALAGIVSTACDLAAHTRRLEVRARRMLASCLVGMAVDGDDAAIQSTFASWEAMYSRSFLTAGGGWGGRGGQPRVSIARQTDLAFAVALTACPDDAASLPKVDNRHDPRQAFYDAAAMLRFTLCEECAEVNVASAYNHTLYALVHPDARYCSVDGRPEYDRVAVLQSLGYRVEVKGEPVGREDIGDAYLSAHVEDDVGVRDLVKLHAYTLTRHKVVVLVDFTTALLQPLDEAVDDLLANPTAGAAFAMDYATHLPANGLNHGANMGLFMLKPSFAAFAELVDAYKTTPYDAATGWNGQGVGGFDGAMGTSGLLTHYYRSRPYVELNKCLYSNEAAGPRSDDGSCRDGAAQCDDCRLTVTNRIEAGRYDDAVCGKPWHCSWDDGWDVATKEVCRYYHNNWFSNRLRFEQDFWIGGPEPARDGTLHPDVFLGYCSEVGVDGYEPMIPENYSPVDPDADTSAAAGDTTTATTRRRR